MVRHPGIPGKDPDEFWEYIPAQIEALPAPAAEIDAMESESNPFDLISPPKQLPLKKRVKILPADFPAIPAHEPTNSTKLR